MKVRAKSGPSSGLRFPSPAYGEKENSRTRLYPSPCEAGRRWPKSLPRTRYGAGRGAAGADSRSNTMIQRVR